MNHREMTNWASLLDVFFKMANCLLFGNDFIWQLWFFVWDVDRLPMQYFVAIDDKAQLIAAGS